MVVKNLFYIGKCFCAISDTPNTEEDETGEEDKDEEGDEEGHVEAQSDPRASTGRKNHPLSWLFSKLSYQARSAHIARRNKSFGSNNWVHQPASVLRWFAAMASFMEPSQLSKFLNHILSPVYRIVEDDTIKDSHMEELKTLAVELQEILQTKVGTTTFANAYNQIRQGVLGVQRERKTARAVQATNNPAVAAKRKMQRNVSKKESRKRKDVTFSESKGKIKRRRQD